MALQVIPGVHLVNVARYPVKRTTTCQRSYTSSKICDLHMTKAFISKRQIVSAISLLQLSSHTWDQWFEGSLCRGGRWRWQIHPQRETWGWGCGWTGAHSASPGSVWNKEGTNQSNNLNYLMKTNIQRISYWLMSRHYSKMWSEIVDSC